MKAVNLFTDTAVEFCRNLTLRFLLIPLWFYLLRQNANMQLVKSHFVLMLS